MITLACESGVRHQMIKLQIKLLQFNHLTGTYVKGIVNNNVNDRYDFYPN